MLEPPGNILVCVGQPKAYNFNGKQQAELDQWFDNSGERKQPPSAVPFLHLPDSY